MGTITPSRPVLRYPGGKWKIAPWIIKHFPSHNVYVEPYSGAGSVLLRKPRSPYGEVLNDMDSDVVNLFKVLRSSDSEQLVRAVEITPFARDEFDISREVSNDPVERARRFLVRSFMGQGSCILYENNGFRSKRSGDAFPSIDWINFPPHIRAVIERLQGVVIENKPALEIIQRYDGPDVLFYVDPPYPHTTRTDRGTKAYRHEMTDHDHRNLAEALKKIKGQVVLSGYNCDLYEELYSDWTTFQHRTMADRAVERIECLWLSPGISRNGWLFEKEA